MTVKKEPVSTVTFVDQYCSSYQDLFAADVRSYEYFKYLHLGLLSELPRKSLPAIARAVGLSDGQELHHFLAHSPWEVASLRQRRIALLQSRLRGREILLCIDETGDKKKGKTTDYAASQYIGNLGKTANGVVSVNAYGVLDGMTFPLLFKVFKPKRRLQAGDEYRTKPQLAVEIIDELKKLGFKFSVVLADCVYGESSDFIAGLERHKLKYVLAIRSNHGVWLPAEQRVYAGRWTQFDRVFSNGQMEVRYLREIIYGVRREIRYYQITTDKEHLPADSTWFVMTNLEGRIKKKVGNVYGLRTWIEYGFKQIKDELGWADYRLTDYAEIERWWEVVSSAYTLVSVQSQVLREKPARAKAKQGVRTRVSEAGVAERFPEHKWWDEGKGWKNVLNNLRLIIQPYIFLPAESVVGGV
jgi:SRSO17 transposase